MTTGVAIIGSGNIGTDLMIKVIRLSETLHVAAMIGIDADSDGLARARRLGIATSHEGVEGLVRLPEFADVELVFDATSAGAHPHNDAVVRSHGKIMVDLTPAAIGPYVIPPVNLDAHLDSDNVNMVTCGGQATVPMIAAVSRVAPVAYGEIVASIASRSAGPGTRANIDEFTETTAKAIEAVGGAERGKAIIVLNPAEPPLVMRDTVVCLVDGTVDEAAIRDSVQAMADDVRGYVGGYLLKQEVQFDAVDEAYVPALDRPFRGTKVSIFLEVTGSGHYLPEYAGNLDIMTSAALRTAEQLVARRRSAQRTGTPA
ncbi:acetaldehyde dehydrogenase (acetylating) [Microterricola viridarii]|uniref:Acetaldehyde dehydrogenase n=1 Tax=Microterricola viridarii TaxID=412690 RepID=A0A0Y0Q2A1_9MICO|nr:acetaldehyde dehydrogenase (acetylating) [Microterricola viridarii]AMB60223.1 acetaldehyde dehydrogenase (acetylating) [Microterricola viridarii]